MFRPAALELTVHYARNVARAPIIGYLAQHRLDLFTGDPQITRGPSLIAEDVGTGVVHEVAATLTRLCNSDGSARVEIRGSQFAVGWANAGTGAASPIDAARVLLEALVAAHAATADAWPIGLRHRSHVYRIAADPVSLVTEQLAAPPSPTGLVSAEIAVRAARTIGGRRATIALRQQAGAGLRVTDGPILVAEIDVQVLPSDAPLDRSALAAVLDEIELASAELHHGLPA